jgi:hypothetical protein
MAPRYAKRVLNAPKNTYLISPCEKDFITTFKVEGRGELPRAKLKSPHKLNYPPISLNAKSRVDGPLVLQTTSFKAIIQRNPYRHAKAELGLYLLMTSGPTREDTRYIWLNSSSEELDSSDESETSTSFSHALPAHLYTPKPLPMVQKIKNWWRYR